MIPCTAAYHTCWHSSRPSSYLSKPTPVHCIETHIACAVEIHYTALPILIGFVLVHHYVPDPYSPVEHLRRLPVYVQGVPVPIQGLILLRETAPMPIPLVHIISLAIRRHGRIPPPVTDLGPNVAESAHILGGESLRDIPVRLYIDHQRLWKKIHVPKIWIPPSVVGLRISHGEPYPALRRPIYCLDHIRRIPKLAIGRSIPHRHEEAWANTAASEGNIVVIPVWSYQSGNESYHSFF